MVFQTWNRGKKSKKESNSIVSLLLMSAALPIAPFICEHIFNKMVIFCDSPKTLNTLDFCNRAWIWINVPT